MRRLILSVGLIAAFTVGASVGSLLPRHAEALPPKPGVPGPCTCGCIATGKCDCPNCAVGCGFLPATKKGE